MNISRLLLSNIEIREAGYLGNFGFAKQGVVWIGHQLPESTMLLPIIISVSLLVSALTAPVVVPAAFAVGAVTVPVVAPVAAVVVVANVQSDQRP